MFTLEMARQILGATAKQSEISAPFAGSSDDLEGSTCTYEAEAPTPVNRFVTTITASVLLKRSRTDTGKSSNEFAFERGKTEIQEAGEQTETVSDLADAAYYIGGTTNQLHVLVGGGKYQLIVSADDPNGNHRPTTEKLARMIVKRL